MPIKGLTDRGLAFPEIGQIRKGAKKQPNKPGADLTYFRVEFAEREQKAQQEFLARYGDKPSQIRIILPFNEIDQMWDAWYEAYTAGRMVARSDGEYLTYQVDETGEILVRNGQNVKTGERVSHPADGIAGKDYKGQAVKFKATGRLKVVIPELARAAYLTLMTTSTHDIANISAQLAAFKELNGGQIAGIPLILRRRPKEISTPSGENGQWVRRTKWLVSIEADPEWVRAKLTSLKQVALPEIEQALLPEGRENLPIESEFEEGELEVKDVDDAFPMNQDSENEAMPPQQLIKPMSSKAVKEAAGVWGISESAAAKKIAKLGLGKQTEYETFHQAVLDSKGVE